MVEVRQGPKSDAERISARLNPSCAPEARQSYVVTGSGPTRTCTSVHRSGFQSQHGEVRQGEGTIVGSPNKPMPNKGA
jgi:hypothetical protein